MRIVLPVTTERIKYIPALDGLRAVAVSAVLITHASGDPATLPGGFGVDVFFVLSGFLITTLLIMEWRKTQRIALGTFWLRRFVRLYPALLTFLAFTVVALLVLYPAERGQSITETIGAALYLTPFTEHFIGVSDFYGHLWSLAYEEYFYLAWPLAFIAFMKLKLNWKLQAGLMIAAGCMLYLVRVYSFYFIGHPLPMFRVGGIAIGCGVGIILANTTARGNARLMAILAILGLAGAWLVSGKTPLHSLNPILAGGAAVAFIYSALGTQRTFLQALLETKPFVYVGRISYELYLWHPTLLIGAAIVVGSTQNQVWWWVYPVVFVFAAATHEAYKPLQKKLRRKLADREARRAPVPVG